MHWHAYDSLVMLFIILLTSYTVHTCMVQSVSWSIGQCNIEIVIIAPSYVKNLMNLYKYKILVVLFDNSVLSATLATAIPSVWNFPQISLVINLILLVNG